MQILRQILFTLLVILLALGPVVPGEAQAPISGTLPNPSQQPLFESITEATSAPVGQIGGAVMTVAKSGEYVYTNHGARLVVLQVDPGSPSGLVEVGRSEILPGFIVDLAVVGELVYATCYYNNLMIFDVSDKTQPNLVSQGLTGYRVSVDENYLYVSEDNEHLSIYDITSPTQPELISRTYLHHLYAMARGQYLYLSRGSDLAVYSLADPHSPELIAALPSPSSFYEFVIAGDYIYIEELAFGMLAVNIADPENPFIVASYTSSWTHDGLAVDGNYLYAAGWAGGVRIFDISTPSKIAFVNLIQPGGYSQDIVVEDGFAYIASDLFGVSVFNVSNPSAAWPHSYYFFHPAGSIVKTVLSGEIAYILNGYDEITILDISSPEQVEWISTYRPFPGAALTSLLKEGGYLYVCSDMGMAIQDLSDPTAPQTISTYDISGVSGISGDYLYALINNGNNLEIVDVADKAAPEFAANIALERPAAFLRVAGGYAYIYDTAGFHVFSLAAPSAPVEVGFLALGSLPDFYLFDFDVEDDYAYLAGTGGMDILDLGDKTSPQKVSHYDFNNPFFAVYVKNNRAYFNTFSTVGVLNVEDKEFPYWMNSWDNLPSGRELAANENYVFFSATYHGLFVLETSYSDPVPEIVSLSAQNLMVGSEGLSLILKTRDITRAALVLWDGMPLPTTSLGSGLLLAEVSETLLAKAGTYSITVQNPGFDQGCSQPEFFVVYSPDPVLEYLMPSGLVLDGPGGDISFIVRGINFTRESVVWWDDIPLNTTFVTTTELTALIPPALQTSPGTFNIKVVNPAPSGGETIQLPFTLISLNKIYLPVLVK